MVRPSVRRKTRRARGEPALSGAPYARQSSRKASKSRHFQNEGIPEGPTELAAITKHEGFKWVARKHYFNAEFKSGDMNMKNRGMNSTLQVRALSAELQGSASFVERIGNYASQALLDSTLSILAKRGQPRLFCRKNLRFRHMWMEREGAVAR